MMNLTHAPLNCDLIIDDIALAQSGFESVVVRMQELGLMPLQKIQLLEKAGLFGSTYLVQVNGLKLALSQEEARHIKIVESK
jgi:Fe2+ transport system protein FeoA